MEAQKNEYFLDGFYIKHFKKFPQGCNIEDFFEVQQIFLLYLIGLIPSFDDWSINMQYTKEHHEIELLTEKDIEISKVNVDLATFQGRSGKQEKLIQLKLEKEKRFKELNKKYGVEEKKEQNIPDIIDSEENDKNDYNQEKLFDILNAKGLFKKKNA